LKEFSNERLIEIRVEKPGDESAICELTERTFEGSDFGHKGEAGLVEK
jgi:predicted N-acetyltransferase YhbS